MRIYLVRHGHTSPGSAYNADLGHPDPALSDTGIRQAEMLGARLLGHKIAAIYSSDLKRARETAEIIARYANAEVILRPQLREIDMGGYSHKVGRPSPISIKNGLDMKPTWHTREGRPGWM